MTPPTGARRTLPAGKACRAKDLGAQLRTEREARGWTCGILLIDVFDKHSRANIESSSVDAMAEDNITTALASIAERA
jgi:hypothetical protein